MALFGSKKKTDTDAAPVAPVAGVPDATNGIPPTPPAAAPVVKEKKARPTKGSVKSGSIIGLNIGNALIKAVEVTAKNGQVSVTRVASVPTPAEAYQNGVVLSVSALSNAIKALWKMGGFKGKAVISSVAGTGSLVVRVIEVPLMTDAQLADAMRADAQLYIPFPPTEVQMDFKALRELPTDPDAGTMDVLLAAAQSEIIDSHIKTLQTAKLDPRSIDVEPIAAGRTLALQKRGDFNGLMVDYNEITAVVNIGAMGTEISLLRGDALVFTRTVSTGGNTISQSIADALGVPLVEGERIKVEQGDALPPEGYQSGQAGDYGFGDQGGGFDSDFDDFGLSDTSSSSGSTNRTTVLDTPQQTSTSTDPFDLDFFNQGPKNEPGAGHSQKEGQPNPQGGSGGFSFDDFDLLPAPEQSGTPNLDKSPNISEPPATETTPNAFNFDFDMASSDLPSSTSPTTSGVTPPAAPPSSAPPTSPFDFGGDETLSDEFLPSRDTEPFTSTPQSSAPIPSAFDFSDFDLPATNTSPITSIEEEAPVAASSISPAQSGGFSFDEISNEPLVASATPISETEVARNDFDFSDVGTPVVETAPLVGSTTSAMTPPTTSDDDIFVAPATSEAFAQPSENEGVSFDSLDLAQPGISLDKPADDGGLNLGGVSEDPFGFGVGSEEFGGFGAGLSAGTEAESSAIYEALANAVEELASEISRSLSFYLERVPDAALSRIYLTGGGALLKNLDVFLTGRLGAPTAVLNPLLLLPVSAQSELPNGPLYTVSLGLALRDFVE